MLMLKNYSRENVKRLYNRKCLNIVAKKVFKDCSTEKMEECKMIATRRENMLAKKCNTVILGEC